MPHRISWTQIKERIVADDMLLFAFPRSYQQLLLNVHELLTWNATYRTEDYDPADKDDLDAIVSAGMQSLMDPLMLQDILGYIDDIETILAAIRDKPAPGCCPPDGTTTLTPHTEPTNSWTSDGETYPATYAGNTLTSAAEYHAYLCAAAQKLVDGLATQFENTSQLLGAGLLGLSVLTGIMLSIVTAGTAVPVAVTMVAGVWAALHAVWETGAFDGAITDLNSNRASLICAALQNDAATFAAAVELVVGATAWNAFFSFLPYDNMIASLFTGTVNGENITGLVPDYDSCDCVLYDFDETFTFDTDSETWAMARATWSSLHGGSIALAPTVAGYAVLNLTEDAMLDILGVADGTYITPTYIKIEYYLTVVGDGSALLNNSVFGNTTYDLAQPALSTLTADADASYSRNFTSNDALQLTDLSTSQVCRLELTRTGGSPAPVMYIKSIRLAGTVGI